MLRMLSAGRVFLARTPPVIPRRVTRTTPPGLRSYDSEHVALLRRRVELVQFFAATDNFSHRCTCSAQSLHMQPNIIPTFTCHTLWALYFCSLLNHRTRQAEKDKRDKEIVKLQATPIP